MSDRVACPRCNQTNAANQRFCGSCGTSLTIRCSSCAEENPPTFRFCGGCGAALTERARDASPGGEERRWATVLFGDLSGFTRLSERMDPEEVRDLIDSCMTKLGEIVERYEGRVERVTGDEIMVVFGAPRAHEDDPERAVRTALEMQRFAVGHAAEFGELKMRIGVNTGDMMFAPVGPEGARQHTVMGDAVNTASRLESAAPLGGVLVGRATHEATKHAIRYDEVEPIIAKGKDEPVAAWVAVEALTDPATRLMSELPLVGREDELGLLQSVWRRVASSSHAQLVTIVGQAGIGKSKLAREFIGTLGCPNCWGRSLPYGERAGGAFGQIIRQFADVYVTDAPNVALDKLASTVENLFGAPGAELAAHLATIVGQGAEQEVDRADLFAAARRFVGRLAEDGPIAIVFEDVQWADESLLELIHWLVKGLAHAPILFLTLTRPELLDRHSGWGGGIAAHTSLPLEPLPHAQTRELARRLRAGLDETALDRIQESSGGNPLFVEELTAWLSDASPDERRSVPTTVTSIVAARLDALPTRVRQLLLDASVVGLSFWKGSLESLAQTNVTNELEELVARELIRKQATSRVPGDEEYMFRHQLIHDVAYEILPKAVRRKRHEAAARYIEERVANSEVVAAILAHHWREAGDDVRAVNYLLAAADVAGRGWEQREAIELLRQATALVPPEQTALKRAVAMKAALARQKYVHAVMDEASIRRAAANPEEDLHEH